MAIKFDFFLMMDIDGDGKTTDDSTGLFGRTAAIAKSLGLVWGSTPTRLIQTYSTPEAFMRTWKPVTPEKPSGWRQEADGKRYYLGPDGAMVTGHRTIEGKWYVMDPTGRMIIDPVTLVPGDDGALQYPGLGD